MEPCPSDRAEPLAPNGIVRRDKHANGGTDEIFQVFATIGNPLVQFIATLEFATTIGLVVIIAVEHHFVAAFGGPPPKVFHQRAILVKRVDGPAPTVLFGYALARPGSMVGNDSERDWPPPTDIPVCTLELFRGRKEARVVVANAELHAKPG